MQSASNQGNWRSDEDDDNEYLIGIVEPLAIFKDSPRNVITRYLFCSFKLN